MPDFAVTAGAPVASDARGDMPNAMRSEMREALLREQHRSLSRQIPTMYMLLLINTCFVALLNMGRVPALLSLALPSIIAVGLVIRLAHWMRRRSISSQNIALPIIERELKRTVIAAYALSAILAAWTIAILASSDAAGRALVPFYAVLSTVTCGYCLVSLPRATDAVIFVGTLPITIALMLTGDLQLQGAGLNLLLVAGLARTMVQAQFAQLRHLLMSWITVEQKQARVYELAHIDDLTGLPNRRAFLSELARASRSDDRVGVIMLDLDGFKPVNDTYGHAAGDELLIGTANRLNDALPPDCLMARLGGDEFAILHRGAASPDATMRLALTLHALFDQPFDIGNQQFRIGSSVGVTHKQLDGQDAAGLIHQADLALYDAKRRKLPNPLMFTVTMAAAVRRRMAIEQALAESTLASQVSLVFQPLVDPRSGKTTGFEALARWQHPTLGAVPPSEFIAIAEQCGMIEVLTASLFQRAVATANQWPDTLTLSFNLSAAEVGSPTLVERMAEVMRDHRFNPARLAAEVTETALLYDIDHARTTIAALRGTGAQVWLDDFGAGYASIGYLREMAFDAIKLDGSLVRDVTRDTEKRNLLIGVIHLCEAINAPVIVEMVETQEQITLLRHMPVARVQGHALSPCLSPEQTLEWIARSAAELPQISGPLRRSA